MDTPTERLSDYEIPGTVMTRRLGEELVLVDLDSGQYYTLSASGTMVWENLAQFESIAALSQFLAGQMGVGAGTVRADIEELLAELVRKKLLHRK